MLDGTAPDALAALVARCADCASLVARLQRVDEELRAAAWAPPPPGLPAAVLRRLAADVPRAAPRPLVRDVVLDAGLIATGIALASAALAVTLSSTAGTVLVDQVRLMWFGLEILMTGLPRVDVPLFWPLHAAVAAALALAWFAVLVMPRRSAAAVPIAHAR
jgi:hypothetical protein